MKNAGANLYEETFSPKGFLFVIVSHFRGTSLMTNVFFYNKNIMGVSHVISFSLF